MRYWLWAQDEKDDTTTNPQFVERALQINCWLGYPWLTLDKVYIYVYISINFDVFLSG